MSQDQPRITLIARITEPEAVDGRLKVRRFLRQVEAWPISYLLTSVRAASIAAAKVIGALIVTNNAIFEGIGIVDKTLE